MSFKSLLLVTLACLIYTNEASDILKALPQAQVILQKFLNIVEANQLNVSIVTSQVLKHSYGQQQLRDSVLLLPTNNAHLTQPALTQQVGKQWLADLQSWTSQGNGIATYRVVNVQNGKISEQLVESSHLAEVPISPSYKHVVEPNENNESGPSDDIADYEVMYNYQIPKEGDQNQTLNILAVNLNITVVESSDISASQVNEIKSVLAKVLMMFHGVDLRALYLAEILNHQISLQSATWQVLIGPESFEVPSKKFVNFSVFKTNVIVFTVDS